MCELARKLLDRLGLLPSFNLRMATRADQEGDRLRQASPFCGILTAREREAIWARYEEK